MRNQEIEVSKQIEALDYEEKLKKTSEYIGRCFIEKSELDDDIVDCFYCFKVRGAGRELESVNVLYYIDADDKNSFVDVKLSQSFNPVRHSEDVADYIEITKEEFDAYYNNAINILNKKVNGR